MTQPTDRVTIAFNMISAEILNRITLLRELREKQVRLEGEIEGLREAQNKIDRTSPKEQ